MSGSGTSSKNIDTTLISAPASSSKRIIDTDEGIDNANKKIRFDTNINSTWNTNSLINKKPKKYVECNTNTAVSNTTIMKDVQCLPQSTPMENTVIQDKESSIKLNVSKKSVNSDLVIIQNLDSKDWEEPIESVKSNDKYVYFSSDVIVGSEDYMITTSNKITPTTALSSQSSEIIPLSDSSVSTLTKQLDISPQKCTSKTTSTVKNAELISVRQTTGNQQNTHDEVELVLISSVDEPKKPALELLTNTRSVKPAPLTRIVPSTNVVCQNAVTTCGINTISSQNTILQSTPTALIRPEVQTALKNQPIVVTPKKLMSEVMQTTAKVSIGNTTISVPLLKPLNTKQLQSSNMITETQKPIQSSNFQSQTCQQSQPQNPLKILNMKCGQKTNQPTIVSLSQLQIKPAKIVQAKVLAKKMQMPLQLQQLSNTSVTSQAKTSSNIVTICGTKQSKQNITHNFNPKVAQLAIMSDSLLIKKVDDNTINSTESGIGALDPSNPEGNLSTTTTSQTSTKTKLIDTTQTFEKKVWVCKDVTHKIPETDSMSSIPQKKDFQPANNTPTLMTSLLRYPVDQQCLKLQNSSNSISSAISIIRQPVPQLVTTNATINNTVTSQSESNLKTSVNLNSAVGKINTSLFSRNISLRLTKNPINVGVQQSKGIPSSAVNSSNITTYTNAATTEYLSKKMNFSMHNSLNITEVHIPNKNSNGAILSDGSSMKINTGSIELQPHELRSTQEQQEFPNKTTSKNIALHYAAISNNQKQKRSKSIDDTKNKEDSSIIKMPDIDTAENKNIGSSDISNDNEFNKRSNNVTELKNNMALSIPLQPSGNKENQNSSKLEETPNVLLKQLLQNTSAPHSLNQVSASTPATTIQSSSAGDSASSSLCNPLISSRKVINVRAPCLGTVSSLEAQLARPVIPPVPASTSTTTHIQVESSDSVNKMGNQQNKAKETNLIADQNDIKLKSSTTQIISKETSFISNPTANVPALDGQRYTEIQNSTPDSHISMDSSSLIKTSQTGNNSTNPNQLCSFSKSSLFENNTDKFADGHLYLNVSTNDTHASDAHFSGIKTVNAITTKILNSKHVDEPGKSNSITLIEDNMKGKSTQNLLPLSTSTCTQNMMNVEDKSSSKDNSFVLTMDSMKIKTNVLESANEVVNRNKSENASCMKQLVLEYVEGPKAVPALEKNSHNEQMKAINSEKSLQVSKDVEFRKKRKREYQKQRRQMLITNKDPQNVNSNLVTSNLANFKRRPRKLLKLEEDHDNFIENLLSRIRQMQPLQVQEPLLNRNYGICPTYEKIIQSRSNLNKEDERHSQNQLSGEYGCANQLNVHNLYKNKDFNKLKDRSKNTLCTIQNDFYDQEFLPIIFKNDYDKQLRFIGLVQDRNMEVHDIVNKACANSNSNENDCTSSRIPYPGLLLHNNENSQWMHGRMSPIIPKVSPFAQDLSICINSCKTLDEGPKHTKGKYFTMRENGSVNQMVILSLSHSSSDYIFGVLKDLANLLNISVPSTYKIIDSPKPNAIRQYQMRIEKRDHLRIRQFKNTQSLLNGNKKICRNCGQTIVGKGVRIFTKKFPSPYSQLGLLKFSRNDLYFCNLSCYENIKMKYEKPHVPSGNELESQDNKTSINNTEDSSTANKEEKTKKSRFKYFNNKCFKTVSQLKRLSEKDLVDVLFKAELTVTASNTNKCDGSVQNSADDIRQCILCNQRGDGLSDGPSRLLNFEVDKWVHLNCALWSNGVYETISGSLMNLQTALQTGFNQICSSCQTLGATIKCFKNRCGTVLHLPCAIKKQCVFYKNKTMHCQQHAPKTDKDNELVSLSVNRRVFIDRDENRQVATIMHHSELTNLLRVGSLTFLNVGQLLPHQLQAFHTNNYIYPIGYKIIRFYWSMKRPNKRCRYICSIEEVSGRPEFCIQVKDNAECEVEFRDSSPKAVWQKIIEPIAITRKNCKSVQLFPQFITGEDLFGLTEPAIVRIIESLPGIETLTDYRFKYGRNPFLELPLAINPTGSARTEPKQRQLISWRKPHTQRTANVFNQRAPNTSAVVAGEVACPYSKQFVHSKSSQYKKMKQEWRNNVYLARSKIQGLGLYAARDIEKHTMIIEYIGEVIRTEVSEIREKQYESKNRGIYMFRLDEDRVVDATLSGGLARYINHSCNPNCVTEIVEVDREVRIIIFAKRRINRAEELSYDYKFDIEDEANKIPCMCAAANCRKWMN